MFSELAEIFPYYSDPEAISALIPLLSTLLVLLTIYILIVGSLVMSLSQKKFSLSSLKRNPKPKKAKTKKTKAVSPSVTTTPSMTAPKTSESDDGEMSELNQKILGLESESKSSRELYEGSLNRIVQLEAEIKSLEGKEAVELNQLKAERNLREALEQRLKNMEGQFREMVKEMEGIARAQPTPEINSKLSQLLQTAYNKVEENKAPIEPPQVTDSQKAEPKKVDAVGDSIGFLLPDETSKLNKNTKVKLPSEKELDEIKEFLSGGF